MNVTATTNDPASGDRSVIMRLDLADPDQRPDSNVVIFDGHCRFCQKQVKRLNRFDGGQRLSYISLHDPRVAEKYPDLTYDQLMEQMYVVSPAGKRYGGAGAVRYLSRQLPRLWWLAPLLHIPLSMPLWQWLYRRVAVRRYKLSESVGAEEACEDACQIHFDK